MDRFHAADRTVPCHKRRQDLRQSAWCRQRIRVGLRYSIREFLEKAIFGQPEVGAGLIPGGGGMGSWPLLVGKARALEIIMGADDFDAATAERYGWVNRAVPDAQLDEFVANFANRVASFDRKPLAEAKRLLNRKTLPAVDDFLQSQKVFIEALGGRTLQLVRTSCATWAWEPGAIWSFALATICPAWGTHE